ncbi:MAG: hypothetical protein ACRD9S_22690 [Pyrinomonadaceae bacterium]
MFTEVGFGTFVRRYLDQAKERYGIEFGDKYPNPAVYTIDAKGAWAYEIFGGFSVRVFRWRRCDLPEVIISGPYSAAETSEEFEARFDREFWAAIEKLRID